MKTTFRLVVGATAAFAAVQAARLSSCGLNDVLLEQVNVRCSSNMNQVSSVATQEACCPAGSELDDSRGDDQTCRTVRLSQAYCPDNGETCAIDEKDELRVNLDILYPESDTDPCCTICTCYGDPECVGFNNQREEWVICDSRHPDSCAYDKRLCQSLLDHTDQHHCRWVKDDRKLWKSFAQSGGPCQPDFTRPDFEPAQMLMHKRGAFELILTLGERGVITQIDLSTSDGKFAMNSDACFSDGASAWQVTSGSLPNGWTSTPINNDQEISWLVSDTTLGINVDIVCSRLGRNEGGTTRFDIKAVMETAAEQSDDGFCSTGVIGEKSGTNDDTGKHTYCTEKSLPPLDKTCTGIFGRKCGRGSKRARRKVVVWCDRADLARTPAKGDAQVCKSELLLSNDDQAVAVEWINYICDLNGVERLECQSKIGQFGIGDFMSKFSNGLTPNSNTPNSCVSDSTLYQKNTQTCRDGVDVEYYDGTDWIQVFFIPASAPPCNGELVINGADDGRDVLFKYPVRFSQCSLSPACLARNDCMASSGFTLTTDFGTLDCPQPTPSPTSKSPTLSPTTPGPTPLPTTHAPTVPKPGPDCYTCTEAGQQQQTICDGNDSTPLTAGSCDTCCIAEDILKPYPPGTVCREISLDAPYCDASQSNDMEKKCKSLSKNNGKLTVNLGFDESNPTSCCNTCTLFGDPFGRAFNNEYKKWILCDARGDDCWVKEDVCAQQFDYDGIQCAWNQGLMNKLKKRGDIGAYGSPCQSVTKPWLLMYDFDGFKVETSTGERAVIDDVRITTGGEVFQLMADDCFDRDQWRAWDRSDVTDHLEVSMEAGPGADARTWTIVDHDTSVFIKAVCIRKVASNRKVRGYRINVETLISLNDDPSRSSGFCADGVIDQGLSTQNNLTLIDKCDQRMSQGVQICKALHHKSCIPSQFEEGVFAWCSKANLWPRDPNRVQNCINHIRPRRDQDVAASKWATLYCEAIKTQRPLGITEDVWIQQCKSRMEVDGYDAVVDQYGRGTVITNKQEANCAMDETYYGQLNSVNICTAGISVEYLKGGEWLQELFIPANLPPCGGEIEFTASRHMNLFIYPIRFKQCEIDSTCPVDVLCMPELGYDIKYLFTQDDSVCPV